ncbi:MAG: DUF4286 family protein [Xanthomonadales bacterium]|nr:DUF4286 family protein [Xanthomonadales bacterium]
MLRYEVELAVEPGTVAEWLQWIPAHVAEILALPGFLGAELLRLEEPGGETPGRASG